MSTAQDNRKFAEPSKDTFTAIAITSSRTNVLAALVEQAVEHFGGGPLFVTDVTVVACDGAQGTEIKFLTAATITRHE